MHTPDTRRILIFHAALFGILFQTVLADRGDTVWKGQKVLVSRQGDQTVVRNAAGDKILFESPETELAVEWALANAGAVEVLPGRYVLSDSIDIRHDDVTLFMTPGAEFLLEPGADQKTGVEGRGDESRRMVPLINNHDRDNVVVLNVGATVHSVWEDSKPAKQDSVPPRRHDLLMGMNGGDPSWVGLPSSPSLQGALWWNDVPGEVRAQALNPGTLSNVRRSDYAGAESCRPCHEENYENWYGHAHRRMNALADPENVEGDFSGGKQARIEYMGGVGTFYQDKTRYRMKLVKGDLSRVFAVSRTIGSRFFQYYVGTQLEGPEPLDHDIYGLEHVLPFGYWIPQEQWVPLVHVPGHQYLPGQGEQRDDPFAVPPRVAYDQECSWCHTTRPAGDWLMSQIGSARVKAHAPHDISVLASEYLKQEHPAIVERVLAGVETGSGSTDQVLASRLLSEVNRLPAREHAVNLGVSCESCHNGARFHAEEELEPPLFFPAGRHVFVGGKDSSTVWGREPENLNFACAKCHSGARYQFAGGMDAWNSTEYSDATRGFCYDSTKARERSMRALTCVHCHDPHKSIGQKWSKTADEDDASCLSCHEDLKEPTARTAHTHHEIGSAGSRCMNCHMPRINEGLQDVVRTHQIFNPTNAAMIEANHPNACNLCHVDTPIDWTLGYLEKWYGKRYDLAKIAENYPSRKAAASLGWLENPYPPVRLAAAEAIARAKPPGAAYMLFRMLNDPILIIRQLTQLRFQENFGIDLENMIGYRFYMTLDERQKLKPTPALLELLKADLTRQPTAKGD